MDDSENRLREERRKADTRAARERRAGPGRRIWIRRDEVAEVAEDKREGERRAETSRRGGDLRRKDQRHKGDRRLD
jgi:hypothetical protein